MNLCLRCLAIAYTDVPVVRVTLLAAVALFFMLLILLTFVHVQAEEKKELEERLKKEAEARAVEDKGISGEDTGGKAGHEEK